MGTPTASRNCGVHGELGHGFGKDHVGAGGDVGLGALDCAGQALAGQRVGARHDDELRIGARIDGGFDAIDHFFGGDELLAGAMAAALGAHLVFDVHGGCAGLDHLADGARDVEGAAPAGVDVDEQRQGAGVGDAADVGEHVFHGADAEVGKAERVGGHASAGEIEGAKTRGLGHPRRIGVDGAGYLQRLFFRERRAKARAGRIVMGMSAIVFPWRIITGVFIYTAFANGPRGATIIASGPSRSMRLTDIGIPAHALTPRVRRSWERYRNLTPDHSIRLCPEEKHPMKRVLICTGLLFAATTLLAQPAPPKKAPASPPATCTATIGGKTITITYSSPRVKGREGKIYTTDGLISHDPHYPCGARARMRPRRSRPTAT